jgi:hypothetical protein
MVADIALNYDSYVQRFNRLPLISRIKRDSSLHPHFSSLNSLIKYARLTRGLQPGKGILWQSEKEEAYGITTS